MCQSSRERRAVLLLLRTQSPPMVLCRAVLQSLTGWSSKFLDPFEFLFVVRRNEDLRYKNSPDRTTAEAPTRPTESTGPRLEVNGKLWTTTLVLGYDWSRWWTGDEARVFEPGSRTYRWVRGPARADLPVLKLAS